MLHLAIIDDSAESRSKLLETIDTILRSEIEGIDLLPRISMRTVALQELKFSAAPDLFVVGPRLVSGGIPEISRIRKLFPDTPIIAVCAAGGRIVVQAEQLARIGIDNAIAENASGEELLKTLILLARRQVKKRTGKLVVIDSGKGGLGVTTIVAALGEMFAGKKKRVLLLDGDSETQDLSRFLQARPFFNEALELILNQQRPLTEEFIEQALIKVWSDEEQLYCLPPAAERTTESASQASRVFISLLEMLDSMFDLILVDASSCRGCVLHTFYRAADSVLFVVDSDPASLFSSSERLMRLKDSLSPHARLLVVENDSGRGKGLDRGLMIQELEECAGVSAHEWFDGGLSFCRQAARWPGSGLTLFSAGRRQLQKTVEGIAERLLESELVRPVSSRAATETIRAWMGERYRHFTARWNRSAIFQVGTLPVKTPYLGTNGASGEVRAIGWDLGSAPVSPVRESVENLISSPQVQQVTRNV